MTNPLQPARYSATEIVSPKPLPSVAGQKRAAEMAAQRILCCYPDYGKAPPEYLVSLMTALEKYPVEVIARLADQRGGIPAKCKQFLPTVGDVVEWGDKFMAQQQEREHQQERADYRASLRPMPMAEYEATRRDDPSETKRRIGFVRAVLGYDPAVKREDRGWAFTPRPPEALGLDPNDFPDREKAA